jgi:hypothetical protein
MGEAWLQADVATAQVTGITLGRDAMLSIDSSRDSVSLFVSGAEMKGEINIVGPAQISAGQDQAASPRHMQLSDPKGFETIEFRAKGEGGVPASLRIPIESSWEIRNLAIDSLEFSEEPPAQPTDAPQLSAIRAGALELYDVSRSWSLGEGEGLRLEGLRGHLRRILIVKPALETEFLGTARFIAVGPRPFERELVPSCLEYLYGQKSLTLLGGLLWSTKRLLSS